MNPWLMNRGCPWFSKKSSLLEGNAPLFINRFISPGSALLFLGVVFTDQKDADFGAKRTPNGFSCLFSIFWWEGSSLKIAGKTECLFHMRNPWVW